MTIVLKDYKGVFFVIITLIIYNANFNIKENDVVKAFIESKEQLINKITDITTNFYTRNPVKDMKYTKNTRDISECLYDMKSLEKYDKEMYHRSMMYIEQFLKLHYKIMMGYYTYRQHYPILKDIQIDLIRTLETFIHSHTIPNTLIDKCINKIEIITDNYLRVLTLKYAH